MSYSTKEKANAHNRQYYAKNRAKLQALARMYAHQLKLKVLTCYSNTQPPSCRHCGVSDTDILCIDHINNNGNEHRKTIRKNGTGIYQWLKVHDYPKGYQTLCFNCNIKKGILLLREKFGEELA